MNSITISKKISCETAEHKALHDYIKNCIIGDTVWGICWSFRNVPEELKAVAERLWEEHMPSDEEGMMYLFDTDILSGITSRDIVTCDDNLTILYDVWYE